MDEGQVHQALESVVARTQGPDHGPKSSNHVHRPRAWSSDSAYSVNRVDTEGTIDSDAEARELLIHADSGPQPVHQSRGLPIPDASEPDADEVRRARAVLMIKDRG